MDGQDLPVSRRFLDPTVGLFVSLYFILVAFFIVMNVISNQDTARRVAVLESVEDAFERPFPVPARAPGLVPPARHLATDSNFLLMSGDLVAALLGPSRRFPTEGGNALEIALPAHSLFFAGSSRLSEQAEVFFVRMNDLIRSAPDAERREIAFLFGQTGEEGDLAWRRADTLARAMVASGIPSHSISVGLLRSAPGLEIKSSFRIDSVASLKLDFAPEGEGS